MILIKFGVKFQHTKSTIFTKCFAKLECFINAYVYKHSNKIENAFIFVLILSLFAIIAVIIIYKLIEPYLV